MDQMTRERTTDFGHPLIMSSRVVGTPVFNRSGERLGHVDDLSIEKESGRAIYAIMSFGGFLGIGEKFHPVPWSLLDYDVELAASPFRSTRPRSRAHRITTPPKCASWAVPNIAPTATPSTATTALTVRCPTGERSTGRQRR